MQATVNLNNDMALWKIKGTQKRLSQGTASADQRRCLRVSIFKRKMKTNEMEDQNWLMNTGSSNSAHHESSIFIWRVRNGINDPFDNSL